MPAIEGISVDFVAHIAYFYVQALELSLPVSTAQRALRHLGLPIVQVFNLSNLPKETRET